MADMTNDFITLTARATQLEAENNELKSKAIEYAFVRDQHEKRIAELITRRNELQTANTHYLERAREFKAKWDAAEQAVSVLEEDRAYWIAQSKDWAAMFANLRQDVETYERKMFAWFRTMRGFGRTGLLIDACMAVIVFAVLFGFTAPILDLRWWK